MIVSVITCNFMSCRGTSWYDEPKFIVYHDNLIELMKKCCKCGQPTSVDRVMRPSGCLVTFNITCLSRKCGHSKKWSNSPSRGRLPLLNILLAAVILFTGCLPTKILRAFNFLNIAVISPRTYFRLQKQYMHGVSELTNGNYFVKYCMSQVLVVRNPKSF